MPDGSEYPDHVGAGHLRHRPLADAREGEAFQAAQPGLRVLGVAPAGPQLFPDLRSGLREGRHRLGAALLDQGIAALTGELAVGKGFLARFLERNERKSAEPKFGSTAADGEALNPTPAAGGPDIEIETLSITIPSGLIDVTDQGRRQGVLGMPTLRLTFWGSFGQHHTYQYIHHNMVESSVLYRSAWDLRVLINNYNYKSLIYDKGCGWTMQPDWIW